MVSRTPTAAPTRTNVVLVEAPSSSCSAVASATNLDLITNMHNEVPFAKDTILLVDILTANRDIVSLKTLHDINMTFILNNVIDPDISITEINEYIEEVIRQLEKGVDPDSIRKTKDTFIIQ